MSGNTRYDSVSGSAGQMQRDYLAMVDPRHILSALAQSEVALPRGTAEDALLSWLLSVPEQIDPAEAAGTMLELSIFEPDWDGEAGRMALLLRQVAEFPAHKLPPARRRSRQH